jgi:hypothetical protein
VIGAICNFGRLGTPEQVGAVGHDQTVRKFDGQTLNPGISEFRNYRTLLLYFNSLPCDVKATRREKLACSGNFGGLEMPE